ncbi:MAG: Capsule biosynthesis protein CapA [Syntrophorhabdaceae bacterium PtaU1.Bin034]|nr:MAG: Capsule biosynthesis protein CapA [Syntrophorhabdaceae bacterium PtaU1.Bin034]
MTGRGIDQILPHPGNPVLYESYMKDARGYAGLAEAVNGPIPKPVDFAYIWGDALAELEARSSEARIINLETSITTSEDYWKGKGINYRMNPGNIPCLQAARIDTCSLANNHVLDWGYEGLLETIATLRAAGIKTSGAGRDIDEAWLPAAKIIPGRGRLLVFAFGHESSGVTPDWSASKGRPGVAFLRDLSERTVESINQIVRKLKQDGDVVVVSIHWGSNWDYDIPREQSRFAHNLIDEAVVDIVHGHSSHHAKGIEVYRDKLILYGCGDLLNDYEGISGYEEFRGDLGILYFATADAFTGHLLNLRLVVMTARRLRLQRATEDDVLWVEDTLSREGKDFGTMVKREDDGSLRLEWD